MVKKRLYGLFFLPKNGFKKNFKNFFTKIPRKSYDVDNRIGEILKIGGKDT